VLGTIGAKVHSPQDESPDPARPLPAREVALDRRGSRPAEAAAPSGTATLASGESLEDTRLASDRDSAGEDQRRFSEAGARVGRYLLLEEVGRGAVGVIYAAYDPKLDRRVAVKRIESPRGDQSLREAQALAKLNHPNVVKVYDAGIDDGRVFMAMEFVVGQSIGEWREALEPSLPAIVSVFQSAALGLAAAHEAGLVHRDFKPDNVMISADHRVLVMDFGLALESESGSENSGSLWAPGTPAYMSPEQFNNTKVGPRADQFSFCVALYEALEGERPFLGANLPALAMAVTKGQFAQPSPLRGVPSWLRRLVLRGLSLRPEDRHGSMRELAQALDRGLQRRRRRLILGVVGTALIGAGALWLVGANQKNPEELRCREAAQALSEDWTRAWAAEAEGVFKTGLPDDGPSLWPRIEGDVQNFASRWGGAYDAACSERFVVRSLEADVFQRRTACLGEQQVYVASLFAQLPSAAPADLRELAAVSAELPRPETCVDTSVGAGDFGRAEYDQIAAARLALMRARGRSDAGDGEGASTIALEVLASLEQVDAPATRAELHALLGGVAYEQGRLEEGGAHTREALREASHSGDPQLTARMWIARVDALVVREGEHELGEALVEAVELATAAVPEDPELQSNLDSLRGIIALRLGRNSEAQEWFTAALERRESGRIPSSVEFGYLSRLGAAVASSGDVERARELFTASGELASSLFGEHHPRVIGAYGNLGLLCRQEGDRDCERRHLERALSLASEDTPLRAKQLVHLGQLEYDQGRTGAAERLALESIAIYTATQGALHMNLTAPRLLLCNVYKRRGDTEALAAEAQRLVEVAESSTRENHPKRAIAASMLGEALLKKGEPEAALAAHDRALEIRELAHDPGDVRIGYSLQLGANTLRVLGRREAARERATRAMAIFDAVSGAERWQAEVRFTLARVVDDPERARGLAEDARVRYEALGVGYEGAARRVDTWLGQAER